MSEWVTITAFGKTFKVLPGHAEDLRSLETEGAVYHRFADRDGSGEFLGTFTRYRISFTPAEIYEYVEAHVAHQQFNTALRETGDFTGAVLAVRDEKYRKRVASYHQYGNGKTRSGESIDIRGCFASFLSSDMEALICGRRRDRYEAVPMLGGQSNHEELALQALKSIPVTARKLATRSNARPAFAVENEYDVQDVAEAALSAVFPAVSREEWTPKSAGSAKRIDLVVKEAGIVVECKYVRDARHAKKVADELRIDFESYHSHAECRRLFAYIHDPHNYIVDPEEFMRDLGGLRKKGDSEFTVTVIVG
ncbi:hypothetical protein [Streptomyces sp. P9-A4]|uniref:PD-(D/E)XK nuclease domain-containing protein n=1 Tax=Streptomyces sp. P9-A4 TaxID=3072285 RepID=UPI002FCC9AB1